MTISLYSFITSVIFFSLSIIVCDILRRKNGFILHYNINIMLCLIGISVFRLCVPLETPMANIIRSEKILPSIQNFSQIAISNTSLNIWKLIVCIWIIGSLVSLIGLFIRIKHDKKTLKSLALYVIEDDDVILCIEQLVEKSKQNIDVVFSPKMLTPMVTGIISPTIILPQQITKLNNDQLQNILIHECSHILNKDLLTKLLVELLTCLMWWNPAMYILKNSLEQVLEIRCDLKVTQKMNKKEKLNYLRVLLLVSEIFSNKDDITSKPVVFSNFGFSNTSADFCIKQRFEIISKYQKPKLGKTIACVCPMILLLILSYSVVLQPYTEGSIDNVEGNHNILPNNAYIIVHIDGTYSLVHNEESFEIPEALISIDPHDKLPKIYE